MHPDPPSFASDWIAAWNAHDLARILDHYAPDATLTSPAAAKLLNDPSGTVMGQPALREYFRRGLEAFPNLQFELLEVLTGLTSVVLLFQNQRGTHTAEFMEFDSEGKVIRAVANYAG
ncbi:MAG TPA: nuclear transport factor 2 family protein [Terriglobales bacterium]|nr:nuclear transport factor 2 family protein [Terriglobales bacterium]